MLNEIIVVILSMHLPNINRIQYHSPTCVSFICNNKILLPVVLHLKILYLCKYKNTAVEKKENKEHMVQI